MKDMKTLAAHLRKPQIYTKTEVEFWNDEYISKQMLNAHLNPDFDGASRKLEFIERSVSWIKEVVPASNYKALLDIGCGPGLYAERFYKAGYQVTGLDFSKRSIEYATNSAKEQGFSIPYIYENYLKMDIGKTFDLCTLIYCDYGALSTDDRKTVLNNVYNHLKTGGKFLLDVFSMNFYEKFHEQQSWGLCEQGGFWRPNEYVEITGAYTYDNHVTLRQTTIVEESGITTYNLWDTYFTKESLINEAKAAGFKVCDVYSDVTGRCDFTQSDTLAILLEK